MYNWNASVRTSWKLLFCFSFSCKIFEIVCFVSLFFYVYSFIICIILFLEWNNNKSNESKKHTIQKVQSVDWNTKIKRNAITTIKSKIQGRKLVETERLIRHCCSYIIHWRFEKRNKKTKKYHIEVDSLPFWHFFYFISLNLFFSFSFSIRVTDTKRMTQNRLRVYVYIYIHNFFFSLSISLAVSTAMLMSIKDLC